jgi:hypothetical protein
MKNQYFGDFNDYIKYALLRAFTEGGRRRVAVCWMLTPPDSRPDGSKFGYLRRCSIWQARDPVLFEALLALDPEANPRARSVRWLEAKGLIPSASYFADLLPDDVPGRKDYFARFWALAEGMPLAFFDPDNGVEVPSCPRGRARSSKYVFFDELEEAVRKGHSVLVFQHYRRVKREPFVLHLVCELRKRTGLRTVLVARTPNVAFALLPQPADSGALVALLRTFADGWGFSLHEDSS